jgi:hypothetical protein
VITALDMDDEDRPHLTYTHERDWMTGQLRDEVTLASDGYCDGRAHWNWEWNDPGDTRKGGRNTDRPQATLAHAGFEIVAQVLAAPLRRAFLQHWNLPHAEVPGSPLPYRSRCPECRRLESLLPQADRPVAYG